MNGPRKADGTPDLRYKANGGGQANRIYPDTSYYGYGGAYGTSERAATPYVQGYNPGYGGYGAGYGYNNGGYQDPYTGYYNQSQYGMGYNYSSPTRLDGMPDNRYAMNRPGYY